MSLQVSHAAFDGPYSLYERWRHWLAWQIGIDLNLMHGFVSKDGVAGRSSWDIIKDDLSVLLKNSLSEQIGPEDAKKIADRLSELLKNLSYEDCIKWYEITSQFRDGCINAFAAGEPLLFN